MTSSANIATAQSFLDCMDRNDVDGAAALLTDDGTFLFTAMNRKATKAEWKDLFLQNKKNAPTYQHGLTVVADSNGRLIERKGSKKISFLKVSVIQTLEFNDEGRIQSIDIQKA
jgi:ketosteroid isomerase-like protein